MYSEQEHGGDLLLRHHHETNIHLTPELVEKLTTAPAGDLLTHGATPLDRIATINQQVAVRENRQKLADTPPEELDIPSSIVAEVSSTFKKRFEDRGVANDHNFTTCLEKEHLDELDPDTRHMLDRARFGQASPAELLYLRNVLGIRSVELACLTHPYGEGIKEYLEPMRDAVKYGIEALGGQYLPNAVPIFAIKEAIIEDGKLIGLLITRKRLIGMMPDDTMVRERSSFILRMDSSEIDDVDYQRFLSYDYADPAWEKQLIDETEIEEIIKELLENDKFGDAIPISSTIYAYNQGTTKEVYAAQNKELEQRRKKFQESLPNLLELLKDAAPKTSIPPERKTFDTIEGMYVNTRPTTDNQAR